MELSILAQIAKEAGDAILKMQPTVVANKNGEQEVKYDGSLVTTADARANEIVGAGLSKHFPSVAVLSEENPIESNAIAIKASEYFATDPLDNTTGYAKEKDGFSVNIGRIKDGVPVDGVIYFPARKELYFVGDDGKAYLQIGDAEAKEITVKDFNFSNPVQIAVGFHEQNIPTLPEGVTYEVAKHPAQYRTCMVAKGECDITGINKGDGGGFNN